MKLRVKTSKLDPIIKTSVVKIDKRVSRIIKRIELKTDKREILTRFSGVTHSSQLGRFRTTSNLVCITEVAIRTTLCIAGITKYICNLVTDSQCTCYKNAFNKRF